MSVKEGGGGSVAQPTPAARPGSNGLLGQDLLSKNVFTDD